MSLASHKKYKQVTKWSRRGLFFSLIWNLFSLGTQTSLDIGLDKPWSWIRKRGLDYRSASKTHDTTKEANQRLSFSPSMGFYPV